MSSHWLLWYISKNKKSRILRERKKQQRHKMAVTLILLIQWSCSLYCSKAYKILHNFLIEHFSKFLSFLDRKQCTTETTLDSKQHRCIALWFSYLHNQNSYQSGSCAQRKILKSIIVHNFFMIFDSKKTEI